MYRENLENKINKLQLWKKRQHSDIQVQSLLDQEMAKMSPIKKMSTSNLRCTSTSPWKAMSTLILKMERYESCLYAQGASGRPDEMDIQESEVNAQTSHSSVREATGETGCIAFTKT